MEEAWPQGPKWKEAHQTLPAHRGGGQDGRGGLREAELQGFLEKAPGLCPEGSTEVKAEHEEGGR